MILFAIGTRTVGTGDDLAEVILESMKEQKLRFRDNDILVLSSKIVAQAEGRVARLSDIKPSEKARRLAQDFRLEPEFAELVLREADAICGGVERAVLTVKNRTLTPNAGIDNKNAPSGSAIMWPRDSRKSASAIREQIRQRTGRRIAVLIMDSNLTPLRIGTTGLAMAVAGFNPVRDRRGDKDIYGKALIITRHAVADDLASAAHLLMGEAAEKTPAVLVRDASVEFDNRVYGSIDMAIPSEECIFMNGCKHCPKSY